jgi:hypothetical protein
MNGDNLKESGHDGASAPKKGLAKGKAEMDPDWALMVALILKKVGQASEKKFLRDRIDVLAGK